MQGVLSDKNFVRRHYNTSATIAHCIFAPPLINSTKFFQRRISMARQSKKIAKRIQPKKKVESENKQQQSPPQKVGKDYLLIGVLALTIVFLLVGWSNFTATNRALYIALLISLSSTYARRHYNLTEVQDMWVERAGYVSMAAAIVLFAFVVYQQYFS
jgi:hypothetical protein